MNKKLIPSLSFIIILLPVQLFLLFLRVTQVKLETPDLMNLNQHYTDAHHRALPLAGDIRHHIISNQ